MASSTTASAFGEVNKELFGIWCSQCKKKTTGLQKEAKSVFSSLCQSTLVETPGANLLQTKPSHEPALGLLIQQLGPAFNDSPQSRIGALHCLWGALEGCSGSVLSDALFSLLGKFLLTHCGPIAREQGEEEEYEEQIRDTALHALLQVVGSQIELNNRTIEPSLIIARLDLAETGVTYRCSEPEIVDHGFDMAPPIARLASGLSTMPRPRRSLCFSVLQAAVTRVEPWVGRVKLDHDLTDRLVRFAKFSAACLHGESDPRCLMALLKLLSRIQEAFSVLSSTSEFPIDEFFDAVSPYYPIRFSPPKNNPSGITRPGLEQALLKVLTCTHFDENSRRAARDTMTSLSLGVILERIIPPVGDETPTIVDQLQGAKDLNVLLAASEPSRLELLEEAAVRQLSDCLLALHEESSAAVVKGGAEEAKAKELASLCRTLVSKIALCCELSKQRTLWDTFVSQPLQRLSSKLISMPTEGRMAIAYMACLAACGGPKTLHRCLKGGLSILLDNLIQGMHDERDVATAVYGIGAFCSSCRVAMQSMSQQGLVIHPHPLQPYTVKIVDKLCAILATDVGPDTPDHTLAVHAAAVRAMDTILTASPAALFEPGLLQKVVAFMERTVEVLGMGETTADTQALVDWRLACSQTVGGVIGKALDSQDEKSESVLNLDPLKSFLQEKVLLSLLSSSRMSRVTANGVRYDLKALSLACTFSAEASKSILSGLVQIISEGLTETERIGSAEAISYILKHGGSLPAKTLQSKGDNAFSLTTVLSKLASTAPSEGGSKSLDANIGGSMLKLPPADDETAGRHRSATNASQIVSYLLPVYDRWVDPSHLNLIAGLITQWLPPLSPSDVVKASVYLPCLGSALDNASIETIKQAGIDEAMIEILPYLCTFALDPEFSRQAKRYAGVSLYAGLVKVRPVKTSASCIVAEMAKDEVIPLLLKQSPKSSSYGDQVGSILSMLAMLAAAAGARGGPSLATSNSIAQILLNLAVHQSSADLLSSHSSGKIDLSARPDLQVQAASAFGSVLLGNGSPSLQRQRLGHMAMKTLSQGESSLGDLAVACHVVCACSNLKSLGQKHQKQLEKLVIGQGLLGCEDVKLQKLVMGATLKIMSLPESSAISDNQMFVVRSVLKMYATSPDLAVKLLCLQVLDAMDLKQARPAVVALLQGAMNGSNPVLRQAGIRVRNRWCASPDQ